MKFTQGEIATIYGDDWNELVASNNESHMGYLRGKLDKLNNTANLENFVGNLDKRNQKNFSLWVGLTNLLS